MATPTESILQDGKEVIRFALSLSYNLQKEWWHLSSGLSLLWFIQPQEMEASGNKGTESSHLGFTKPYCLKITGPNNIHRGPQLLLLSEGGGSDFMNGQGQKEGQFTCSLGWNTRCVGNRGWGALPVARLGLTEQETIPRWKGVLTPFFPCSWDYEQLCFLTGNTEGPVSVCFLKILLSGNLNLQTNRIYTKRFANTTYLSSCHIQLIF